MDRLRIYASVFCYVMIRRPPRSTRTDTLVTYTTLCRSQKYARLSRVAYGWLLRFSARTSYPVQNMRFKEGVSRWRSASTKSGGGSKLTGWDEDFRRSRWPKALEFRGRPYTASRPVMSSRLRHWIA